MCDIKTNIKIILYQQQYQNTIGEKRKRVYFMNYGNRVVLIQLLFTVLNGCQYTYSIRFSINIPVNDKEEKICNMKHFNSNVIFVKLLLFLYLPAFSLKVFHIEAI